MISLLSPGARRVPLFQRCSHNFRAVRSFSINSPILKNAPRKPVDKTDYNEQVFTDTPDAQHIHYRRVTANDLENEQEPPRRVKMLVRDFIEDSLYNPNYGYFPKQATIFDALEPIQFRELKNSVHFQEEVAKRYAAYGPDGEGPGKQLWHTPTELFKVTLLQNSSLSVLSNRS